MRLRTRVTLFLVAIFAIFIVITFLISQTIFSASYQSIENQETKRDVDRVLNLYNVEIEGMNTSCRDWAFWNDSYDFVMTGNESFVQDTLIPSSLVSLGVNAIIYYNISGELVCGTAVDLSTGAQVPVPSIFIHGIKPNDILIRLADNSSAVTGVMMTDEGPMMVASRPIESSTGEGPMHGALVIAKFLDRAETDYIASIAHVKLDIRMFNDSSLPADFRDVAPALRPGGKVEVRVLGPDSIAGYELVNDISGSPGPIFKVTDTRARLQQGQSSLAFFLAVLAVMGILFMIVSTVILELFVFRPLYYIRSRVAQIGQTGVHTGNMRIKGDDELSALAREIDQAISSLNKSQQDMIQPRREEMVDGKAAQLLEPSATYLFLTENREQARELFARHVKAGKEGLWVTRMAPSKARDEYGLVKTPFIWLTTSKSADTLCIDPGEFGLIVQALKSFINAAKDYIILFEGIEYLYTTVGFQSTLKLIQLLNDLAMKTEGVVVISVDPQTLKNEEVALVRSEARTVFGTD